MSQLHHVQCIADSVDFKLSPGVGGSDGAVACVDENDGCPTEAYILCAFEQCGAIGDRIDYLACMDEYDGDQPRPRSPAQAAAQAQSCAQRFGLNWDPIASCATGSHGTELLGQAHTYYESNKDNIRGFPTPLINGKEPWTRDWDTLVKALCDAGVSCACGLHPPSPSPQPYPSPVPSPVPSPIPSPVPSPPAPVPVPSPVPSPQPSPSPLKPGDCFSADADQATCEGTADEKTGKQCKWCGADSFIACATQDWGCDSVTAV